MQWGYIVERGYPPLPLYLDINTHCHALITGASGSGKSYALLYLLGKLLQDSPQTIITFCDFKNSEDFKFLKDYPNYYSGNDCYTGIIKYYDDFCNARMQGENKTRHLLVVDEYPAMINYLTTKDKQEKTKKAGDILSAVAEILMLGRGMKYGIWIVTQRPDSFLFEKGARENFMVICALLGGRFSKEQRAMIADGEEIPERIYRIGEGILISDGNPTQEIAYPRIKNVVDWKRHIINILKRNCNEYKAL